MRSFVVVAPSARSAWFPSTKLSARSASWRVADDLGIAAAVGSFTGPRVAAGVAAPKLFPPPDTIVVVLAVAAVVAVAIAIVAAVGVDVVGIDDGLGMDVVIVGVDVCVGDRKSVV